METITLKKDINYNIFNGLYGIDMFDVKIINKRQIKILSFNPNYVKNKLKKLGYL